MTKTLKRPTFFQSFTRSQLTSAVASGADFSLLFILTEIFRVWYVIAVACGAVLGAVTNFILNRHWTFDASHGHFHAQIVRYSLVSGGSLILNTGGVWLLTEYTHIHYSISVFAVALAVGLFFNYPLQLYFVFKEVQIPTHLLKRRSRV